MEALETTFAGKSVTVCGNVDPDGIARVSIQTTETSIFGDSRTIRLGNGTWEGGRFGILTAVCSKQQMVSLENDLCAHGWQHASR